MSWMNQLNGDPLPWLLEQNPEHPGVCYFVLRDLLGRSPADDELVSAREYLMTHGQVAEILKSQHPDGYWFKPGPGYSPRYRATTWRVIQLAMFGADGSHAWVRKACNYVLDHSRSNLGGFSYDATRSGMVHCLQGNLVAALMDLGCNEDERLKIAINWLARSITGEGIAGWDELDAPVRYYKSGNSAAGFVCAYNNQLPCAWGAVKSILALGKIPAEQRDESIENAIRTGVNFLLSINPATAEYPMGYAEKPNRNWFKFGLPISYTCDILQILEGFCNLGFGRDARLQPAIEMVLKKQDHKGRWKMESDTGKAWITMEEKGQPSKWVTLRALRVLSKVI